MARSQGQDLLEVLTPDHGTTVDLDYEVSCAAKYFGDLYGGTIGMNKEDLKDPKVFEFRLLYETGHWIADMDSWFGSLDPVIPDGVKSAMRDQLKAWDHPNHEKGHGYQGFVYTDLLWGEVFP